MNANTVVQNVLVCPLCKARLYFRGEVINCSNCQKQYFFKDGIYRMSSCVDLSPYYKEQETVFDKVSSEYDKYLHKHPLYVSIKNNYVYPSWFRNSFKDKIVLDIGCGTGWGGEKIVNNCKILINLDISLNNLMIAKEKIGTDNAVFIQSDMNTLPFDTNKVDIITCFWALHHISEPHTVAGEISRVLAESGIFLGVEPNQKYTWVEFWSDLLRMPQPIKKRMMGVHKKIQRYTYKQLEKEEYYMKGIKLEHDHHAGLTMPADYKNMFERFSFKLETEPVGLEIVPPRFFMSKSRFLVNSLLTISGWCIRRFDKKDQGMFFVMKASK